MNSKILFPSAGKTYFIVTVDTETYPVSGKAPMFDQHIYGRIGRVQYGVNRIMDMCDAYDGKATFFVDFCMHHQYGEAAIRDVCTLIESKGHDVQVHAHPNWMRGYERGTLHSYPFDVQNKIIEEVKQLYENCLKRTPLAFRAGAYAANLDTIRALENNGFKVDSSYFQLNKNCVLSAELSHRYSNHMFYLGNVLEVPVTVYSMLGRVCKKKSKIDINACSWTEIKHVASNYINESRVLFVILFLHSFSFIRQGGKVNDISPNFSVIRKFERTLQFLKNDCRAELMSLRGFFKMINEAGQNVLYNDYVGGIRPWMLFPRLMGRFLG